MANKLLITLLSSACMACCVTLGDGEESAAEKVSASQATTRPGTMFHGRRWGERNVGHYIRMTYYGPDPRYPELTPSDVIQLNDGRRLEGKVTKEGNNYIVRMRLGTVAFGATDVLSVEHRPPASRPSTLPDGQREILRQFSLDEDNTFLLFTAAKPGMPAQTLSGALTEEEAKSLLVALQQIRIAVPSSAGAALSTANDPGEIAVSFEAAPGCFEGITHYGYDPNSEYGRRLLWLIGELARKNGKPLAGGQDKGK